MKTTNMIIIENELGKFAFTYDNKNDLVYQQFEKNKQIKGGIMLLHSIIETIPLIIIFGFWA